MIIDVKTRDASSLDASITNSLVNIETLFNLNLDISASNKDKLREIFSLLRNLNPKDISNYHEIIHAVIDMNRCSRFTANRFGPFERRVIKTTHLV